MDYRYRETSPRKNRWIKGFDRISKKRKSECVADLIVTCSTKMTVNHSDGLRYFLDSLRCVCAKRIMVVV